MKFSFKWIGAAAMGLCLMFSGITAHGGGITASAANSQWTDPCTITKVTDENREQIFGTKVGHTTDETYDLYDRRFQSMASIEVTGDRIWAAWTVGGDAEPHVDNYIVIAYSDDGGRNWVDPFIIIDHDDAKKIGVKVCVPSLWLSPQGELWCFYVQSGTCAIIIPDPEASPDKITWTAPEQIIPVFGAQKIPVVIKNAAGEEEWLLTCENGSTEDGRYIKSPLVYASTDKGATWKQRGIATSGAANKRFQESQIVQLKDGRLWMLARIEKGAGGGVEQFFSSDYGKTWEGWEANLPSPLISPGSKFHLERLQSGNLLWVTNLSTSSRTNLTAFISDDDGQTWKGGLLLDDRTTVAYPDVGIGEDGYIHVIWDRNRAIEQEIRMSVFNESDVLAEAFLSDRAKNRVLIAKNHDYSEIAGIETQFSREIRVPVGTASADFLDDLPTTIEVVDDKGNLYMVTGTWERKNYNKNQPGSYHFYLECELPENVQDMRGLLTAVVVVEEATEEPPAEEEPYGCAGSISAIGGAGVAASAAVLLSKKRKRK